MKKLIDKTPTVARILLGLVFFVFGLNGFLGFMPMPAHEGAAGAMMGGLAASGYFFPLLKGTEVLVGLSLLTGRGVPLALILLAPIMVNIVAFHLFLEPASLAMPLVFLGLHLFLAWSYRDSFRGVLNLKARPRVSKTAEQREIVTAPA